MDDWVKKNGITREENLDKYRSRMQEFKFSRRTMKQIYYLNEEEVLEQCEQIEEMSQLAFMAFENFAFLEELKY
jgi:hypothetical protein